MKTFLNPEFALEAQEDHINHLSGFFGMWANIKAPDMAEEYMEKAERFYPNHPTTLKMLAEFDELNKQP